MDTKNQNNIDPSVNKHKRHWNPRDEKEDKIIKQFLSLCSEKLTYSLSYSLDQEDIQKQINRIYNEETSFEELKNLDMDEFFDLLVGQRRFFNDE